MMFSVVLLVVGELLIGGGKFVSLLVDLGLPSGNFLLLGGLQLFVGSLLGVLFFLGRSEVGLERVEHVAEDTENFARLVGIRILTLEEVPSYRT